jgi:hypothetical protein
MYSNALIGYKKAVGPDHPKTRNLQDNLRALDTVTENEATEDEEAPVNNSQGEISHLSAERTPSKSKHHSLLKSLV